jgi:hypothetical protein
MQFHDDYTRGTVVRMKYFEFEFEEASWKLDHVLSIII